MVFTWSLKLKFNIVVCESNATSNTELNAENNREEFKEFSASILKRKTLD